MSYRDPIRVFVTHSFEESDDYVRVFEYLESARNFYYRNCGNLALEPGARSQDAVREELRKQIAAAGGLLRAGHPLPGTAGSADLRAQLLQGQRQAGGISAAFRPRTTQTQDARWAHRRDRKSVV